MLCDYLDLVVLGHLQGPEKCFRHFLLDVFSFDDHNCVCWLGCSGIVGNARLSLWTDTVNI